MSSTTSEAGVDGELRKIAKGAGISFLGRATDQAISVIVGPLYARCLGAGGYGLYAVGKTVCEVVRQVASAGVPEAVARAVSVSDGQGDAGKAKGSVLGGVGIVGIGTVFTAIVLAVFGDEIAGKVFSKPELAPVLRVMAIAIPLGGIGTVLASAGRGRRTVVPRTGGQIAGRVISLAVFVVLWLAGLGVVGAAWGFAGGAAAGLLITAALVAGVFPEVGQRGVAARMESRALLLFGLPLAFTTLTDFGLMQANTLILGARAGSAEVGIYNAAMLISMVGMFPLTALNQVFGPIIADLHARGDRERLQQLYRTTTRWAIAGALPLMLFVIAQRDAVMAVFGAEFSAGTVALLVMCLGVIVSVAAGGVGWLLVMSGRQWLHFANNAAFAAANVSLCWVLAGRFGALGAAAAFGGSMAGANMALLLQVRWLLGLQPYTLRTAKPLGLALGCAVPFIWWRASGLLGLVLLGSVYAVLYAGAYYLTGLDREERDVLRAVRERLRPGLPEASGRDAEKAEGRGSGDD